MPQHTLYTVQPGWLLLLHDLGLSPAEVLRRAELPDDLLAYERPQITRDQYFQLWRGIERSVGDPELPLRIGRVVTMEAFDPAIFAALCSANLVQALDRLAAFKRLIAPTLLHPREHERGLVASVSCDVPETRLPASLALAELVFLVQFARRATRETLYPLTVQLDATAFETLQPGSEYTGFFGLPVQPGHGHHLLFSHADARRAFLTTDQAMWQHFEPALQERLATVTTPTDTRTRVKAALRELLPAGDSTIDTVAGRLGVSKRTLQRRLNNEGESYQRVLNATRAQLAEHYLTRSAVSITEVSLLLGFEDPNSFYRAFQGWTGTTPDTLRRTARH